MIGSETVAIDRWIEPAIEPERLCQRCHHEESLHDRLAARAIDKDECDCHALKRSGYPIDDKCECEHHKGESTHAGQ